MKVLLSITLILISTGAFSQLSGTIRTVGESSDTNFVRNVYERNDSLFQLLNGSEIHIGMLGGSGNLQVTTDNGNVTTNDIQVKNIFIGANNPGNGSITIQYDSATRTLKIGNGAGFGNTGLDGTFIGDLSGAFNSGNVVTAIGIGAGYNNTHDKATIIGNNSSVDSTNQVSVSDGVHNLRFDFGAFDQDHKLRWRNRGGVPAFLDDIVSGAVAGINYLTTTGTTGAATKPNDSTLNIPTPTIDGVLRNGNTTADQDMYFGDNDEGIMIQNVGGKDYILSAKDLSGGNTVVSSGGVAAGDISSEFATFGRSAIFISSESELKKSTILPNEISIRSSDGAFTDSLAALTPSFLVFKDNITEQGVKVKPMYPGTSFIEIEIGGSTAGGAFSAGTYQAVLFNSTVPTSSSDPGVQGQVAYDAQYLYLCISADTWTRIALETSPW